jgi:hypothetical protein
MCVFLLHIGRLNRDLRATLPINELKSKPSIDVCPICAFSMQNGVKGGKKKSWFN